MLSGFIQWSMEGSKTTPIKTVILKLTHRAADRSLNLWVLLCDAIKKTTQIGVFVVK